MLGLEVAFASGAIDSFGAHGELQRCESDSIRVDVERGKVHVAKQFISTAQKDRAA